MLDPLRNRETLEQFAEISEVVRTIVLVRDMQRYRVEILENYKAGAYHAMCYQEINGVWVHLNLDIPQMPGDSVEQVLTHALASLPT
jgi:hypothetical protein